MIIKVRGVIKKEDKIFLASGIKTGIFYLPGGTLEGSETLKECLNREIIEELGIKPMIGDLLTIQEIKSSYDRTILDFWFEILNVDDFNIIDKTKASHSYEWIEAGFYTLENLKEGTFLPSDLKDRLNNNKTNLSLFLI